MSVGNTVMSSYDFAQTIDCKTMRERFLTRAAQVKELTDREMVVEKNAAGELVPIGSGQSTQRACFAIEFFRLGLNNPATDCPDGGPASFLFRLENLARRYAELREELLERYSDDEDKLYRQLGELNQAFEQGLSNAFGLGGLVPTIPQHDASRHIHQDAIDGMKQTLHQNMRRHMSNFFEIFIKSIQSDNFETAFANTLDVIDNEESSSLSNMSFRDTVLFWDTMRQGQFEYRDDENGEEYRVFVRNHPMQSFRTIFEDDRFPEVIRRELADLMGFRWRS